jgi:hypothetical protein
MSEHDETATAVAAPLTARELQARYAAEEALDRLDALRLVELRDRAIDVGLSAEEGMEQLVLERAREDREPRLRRYKLEAASALDEVNIAEVLAVWEDLRAPKAAAYVTVQNAIAALAQAWKGLFTVHQRQVEQWATLPKAGSSLSDFPSGEGLAQWLSGRMPHGWDGILNAPYPEESWGIHWPLVWDVDPGLKPLEKTSVGRINEQARAYRQKMAQQVEVALDTEDEGGDC